jgi:FMN phosphatase YigB (HAD superfamily)
MNASLTDLVARKVWLIDLDGTLIQEHFLLPLLAYPLLAYRLTMVFGWRNVIKNMQICRQALTNTSSSLTNYERLLETACAVAICPKDVTRSIVENFFKKDYPKLRHFYRPITNAKDALIIARQLGYKLILATNPVWPESCVKLRLRQCGYDPQMFNYITHAEIMHSSKPQQSYFTGCLRLANTTSAATVMIGNDEYKDGVCRTANISYYSVAVEPANKWRDILITLQSTISSNNK